MGFEIDMLNVSDGDAIVVRHIHPTTNREWVGVIDGGRTDDDGDLVVQHILNFTGKQAVDDLICSHPDADHIGGLSQVVKSVPVGRAWIHDPGQHIDVNNLSARLRQKSYLNAAQKIYRSMKQCSSFLSLLDHLGIPRYEPFAGTEAGMFQVLGPRESYYEELLQQFDDLEGVFVEDDRAAASAEQQLLEQLLVNLSEASDSVIDEDNTTSAENNTSVISGIVYDDNRYLFTGDSGVPAIQNVMADYDISNIYWLDVPHHGSKHNVCSSILDTLQPSVAYFSAKGTRKHPSRAVINALKRRGCSCYSTHKNGSLCHRNGTPVRVGWTVAEPL